MIVMREILNVKQTQAIPPPQPRVAPSGFGLPTLRSVPPKPPRSKNLSVSPPPLPGGVRPVYPTLGRFRAVILLAGLKTKTVDFGSR